MGVRITWVIDLTEVKDYDEGLERENASVIVSDIIRELGELGIVPYDICTGIGNSSLLMDALWKPRFGISINSDRESHYIFTIAAMSGWNAEYDLNGRGITICRSANDMDETLTAWALLLNASRLVMGEIDSS